MKNVMLITGAASGFGLEYTKLAAKDHIDMVLVDVNEPKLAKIKADLESTYGVHVYTIVADLSKDDTPKVIYDEVIANDMEVEYLINNAGLGDFGRFAELSYEKERALLGVNSISTIYLTHLFGRDMMERKSGKILITGSIASYMPGPYMPMYFATKAFNYIFSTSVAKEFADYGVTCTCLVPGPCKTGFEKGANMKGSKMFTFKPLQACTQDQVAIIGYEAMMKGKLIAHTSWKYVIMRAAPLVPTKLVQRMVTYINIGKFRTNNFKTEH